MPILEPCVYSPEINPGNPNVTPMSATDIVVVDRSTVILTYPYVSPTLTLEIRNPELNDKIVRQCYRVQEYTRGNTLIIFRDPNWFKTYVLNMAFTALSKTNRDDILTFCRASAGKYIGFKDPLSQDHKGIIINPDNPLTQEGPDCLYTWKLDFQGSLI